MEMTLAYIVADMKKARDRRIVSDIKLNEWIKGIQDAIDEWKNSFVIDNEE